MTGTPAEAPLLWTDMFTAPDQSSSFSAVTLGAGCYPPKAFRILQTEQEAWHQICRSHQCSQPPPDTFSYEHITITSCTKPALQLGSKLLCTICNSLKRHFPFLAWNTHLECILNFCSPEAQHGFKPSSPKESCTKEVKHSEQQLLVAPISQEPILLNCFKQHKSNEAQRWLENAQLRFGRRQR